jgi:hypothetical protein
LAATYVVMSISSQAPVILGVKVATGAPVAGRLAYVSVPSDQALSETCFTLWVPPEPLLTNMRRRALEISTPARVWRPNFM